MRKILLASAIALSLSGCATTGGNPPDMNAIIAQIQQTTAQICSFVPTVETVAAIIAAGSGGGATPAVVGVASIANAICAAVTKPAAARRGVPTVNGVPVNGSFVR